MSKLTRLVTSKPALTSSAAALKIPITKRVITLNSIRVASRQAPHDTAPPTMEKTCGLFDFIDPNLVSTEIDKSELDMENNVNINETFFTFDIDHLDIDQSNNITPSSLLQQQQSIIQEPMTPKKKTFAQKLEEANLSIKIIKSDPDEENLGTPMNLDMDDADLAKLLTPNTEQMCLQYLHSIPTDSPILAKPANIINQHQPSARIATEEQLLSSIGLTENELQTLVSAPNESLDHAYSSNKRSSSSLEDDDTETTNFDPNTPTTSGLSTPRKKQRTRGIYRAEDVTNEVDLANYLERRIKNNISSKISRANKKSYYMEMDAKSAALEAENKRLEVKIEKLEKLNQIMKDYLKDAFVGNLK